MYTLVLLNFQRCVNYCLLIFVAIAAVSLAGVGIVRTVRARNERHNPEAKVWRRSQTENLLLSAVLLVGFLILMFAFKSEFFPYIAEFLRTSGMVPWWKHRLTFVRGMLTAVAGVALFFSAYLLVSTGLQRKLVSAMLRIVNRSIVRGLQIACIGLIVLLNLFALFWVRTHVPAGPNVIMISIDALRADHLACYGHNRITSPNLDTLAEKGVVFEMAISQAPWTLPSMATVHTSLYPYEHGAVSYGRRMKDRVATLAERFRNSLYTTIGVVSATYVNSTYGFSQGFTVFNQENIRGAAGTCSAEITDAAIRYVREHRDDSFFLWIHYFDPHDTYLRHEEFDYGAGYNGSLPLDVKLSILKHTKSLNDADLKFVRDVYDGEISYTDKHIGRLFRALEETGLTDETVIAVTADHGEEFGERGGFGHGKNVYQELVRVPLFIYDPSRPELCGRRVQDPVEIRTLGRTLLEAVGLDADGLPGLNLIRIAAGEEPLAHIFSEGSYAKGVDKRKLAYIKENWKLIMNFDDGTYELYNLAADPDERTNLFEHEPPVLMELMLVFESHLSELHKNKAPGMPAILSDEEYKRLKSLGYIGD